MASVRLTLLAFAAVLGATTLACGGDASAPPPANGGIETSSASVASNAGSGTAGGGARDVHAIYDSRCGNCHVRVEPGSHTRNQLETAFGRHRKRVKMNDAEWSNMVDFLASDSATSAKTTPGSAEK